MIRKQAQCDGSPLMKSSNAQRARQQATGKSQPESHWRNRLQRANGRKRSASKTCRKEPAHKSIGEKTECINPATAKTVAKPATAS